MAIFIVFLAIALLFLVVVVFPLKFTLKINLSMITNKAIIAVKILYFMPFVIKLEKEKERFRLSINGKITIKNKKKVKKHPKAKKRQFSVIDMVGDMLKFVERIDCLGIVGGKDVFLTCCNYALITNIIDFFEEKIGKFVLVPDFQKERYIFDVEIKWSVSILDILQLVGEYGSKRNFKTNNRQFKRRNEQ